MSTLEEHLAAVYAAPHDDAPRLVLADFLQERGDPHGEFIALQCGRGEKKGRTKREQSLIKQHAAAFLGPLADVVEAKTAKFRRGFLAVAEATSFGDDPIGRSPAWATLEELTLGYRTPLTPPMRHVRVLRGLVGERLAHLIGGPPWAIEDLSVSIHDLESEDLILAADRVPKLRILRVEGRDEWIPEAPFARQLEAVTVGWATDLLPRFAALPNLRTVGLIGTFLDQGRLASATFSRGEDGAFSHLELEIRRPRDFYTRLQSCTPRTLRITSRIPLPPRELELLTDEARENGVELLDLTAVGGERLTLRGAPVRREERTRNPLAGLSKLAFDADGVLYANGSDGVIVVDRDHHVRTLRCESDPMAIAVSAERVAACFVGLWLRTFDRATGARRERIRLPFSEARSLAFSPDGRRLAVGNQTGQILVVDLEPEAIGAPLKLHDTYSGVKVAFHPDGNLLATGASDHAVHLVDLSTRRTLRSLPHGAIVTSVTFSPDGEYLLTTDYDATVRLFRVCDGQEVARYTAEPSDAVYGASGAAFVNETIVAFFADRRVVSVHDARSLALLRSVVVDSKDHLSALAVTDEQIAVAGTELVFLDDELRVLARLG